MGIEDDISSLSQKIERLESIIFDTLSVEQIVELDDNYVTSHFLNKIQYGCYLTGYNHGLTVCTGYSGWHRDKRLPRQKRLATPELIAAVDQLNQAGLILKIKVGDACDEE
jgi:hypothetical protein